MHYEIDKFISLILHVFTWASPLLTHKCEKMSSILWYIDEEEDTYISIDSVSFVSVYFTETVYQNGKREWVYA